MTTARQFLEGGGRDFANHGGNGLVIDCHRSRFEKYDDVVFSQPGVDDDNAGSNWINNASRRSPTVWLAGGENELPDCLDKTTVSV